MALALTRLPVPPFFALVTRGLGLLEGIALAGDPDFDIFRASYPYATRSGCRGVRQHGRQRRVEVTKVGVQCRW
ncbi:hypothetical protein THAOC_25001, partial [Thalassiosira oceanica]